jgi:hypothetical protein
MRIRRSRLVLSAVWVLVVVGACCRGCCVFALSRFVAALLGDVAGAFPFGFIFVRLFVCFWAVCGSFRRLCWRWLVVGSLLGFLFRSRAAPLLVWGGRPGVQ